jgi:hypothetical protein
MSEVLTAASMVNCPHLPGKVSPDSTSRLRVSAQPVLVAGPAGITGKDVAGCTVQNSQSTKTCLHVLSVSAGEKSRLRVGKVSVLLADLAGLTDGVPPGSKLTVTANQTRLRAAAAVA